MLLALLAGACNVLAFAPFHIWPLQILALAWLFGQAARRPDIRRNFLLGWIYGFGWTACGVHWLYISMHTYGGMAGWMAALAVALLALFIGLYSALALSLATALQRRWRCPETAMLLLLLPALWALTEWVRGWLFTGFPWLSAGYAHSVGPLKGYAPLLGVYGLGWIAAVIAGCCVLAATALKKTAPDAPDRRPLTARALAGIVVLLMGGVALHAVNWTAPRGAPIGVRLLQGNIAQETKFSESALLSTLEYYDAAIRAAPADLIAIPETAIPLLPQQLPANYLESLAGYAETSGSHLALGIPLSDAPGAYSNSLIMFAPPVVTGGVSVPAAPYRYDKHHLVPFGEFIPPGFRWFVDMMHIPLGDMTRGGVLQQPFAVKDQWIMPNICYEDLFGEEIAAQLGSAWFDGKPPASILLNISNIAWFGNSIALPQHLQISQMRALESGRPMLRATNTGATAIIDPKGHIGAELRPFTADVLVTQVQGYQGWTPYMLAGNKLILAIALLALVWARWPAKHLE
ncbi:apolipoprotein N-acyltransferase [Oxalobacteraceae bacterium CAVE-383]|nr:apolipoprotein N-acyltransferase [Oxalobacteraceae bacterium CAVE-383]